MTLNELFYDISVLSQSTSNIINALTDPNRDLIDAQYIIATSYNAILTNFSYNNYHTIDAAQSKVLLWLLASYGNLINEYDDHISRIRYGVDAAFTEFYNQITYKLKQAIGLTWNEIEQSETYVLGLIANIEAVTLPVLRDELDLLDADLRTVIDTIIEGQEAEHLGLWDRIEAAAGEVYDAVTGQITDLVNTVSTWVDELWTYIGTVMDWLSTKFSEFYTQITDWVNETLSSIRARITREVSGLMEHIVDYYNRAESLVNTAKAWLVSEIGRLGDTLRALIQTVITEVTDLLDDLALLTDWRFNFFNLFLSFPELSFLQVLNRDDEDFNRFKPYWQALFARVMEEE